MIFPCRPLLSVVFLTSTLHATLVRPGDLDPSFGTGGTVITPVFSENDEAHAVAVQKDGKIVVAGSAWTGTSMDFVVVRYTASGALDTSFGDQGVAHTDLLTSSNDTARSVLIQEDGKIIVAGSMDSLGDFRRALVRYTAQGELDESFNDTGIVLSPAGEDPCAINDAVLQDDGMIVTAGWVLHNGTADFSLARYTTDGDLDEDFGDDGVVRTAMGAYSEQAFAVTLQDDDKIVAVGYAMNGSQKNCIAVARYTPEGALDVSFSGGYTTTSIGPAGNHFIADQANDVVVTGDGKILVTGQTQPSVNENHNVALLCYNEFGLLDEDFGGGTGIVTTPIGTSADLGEALALQPDGKIVVAGYTIIDSMSKFALLRYEATGALDEGFGNQGTVTTLIGPNGNSGWALALQRDGKAVVAGNSFTGYLSDFSVARYDMGYTLGALTYPAAAAQAGLQGAAAAADAMPFHDGVPNLLKYAFNMDLGGPARTSMSFGGTGGLPFGRVHEVGGSPRWQFQFVRRKQSGLSYEVQDSETMQGFDTFTGTQSQEDIDAYWERITIEAPLDAEGHPARFFRVDVTEEEP